MKTHFRRVLIGATLVVSGVPVLGQTPDFLGTWDMSMQVLLGQQNESCTYSGTVQVSSQIGNAIEGTAVLDLVEGPDGCPSMMTADLTGVWGDNMLNGTLDGGEAYGTASFQGSLGMPLSTTSEPPNKATQGTTYSGPFSVSEGPYTSSSAGTWSAVARGATALAIPSVGPVGVTALILLLLVGGAWLLMQRRLV